MFICKYDFSALVIIMLGTVLIIILANKEPQNLEDEQLLQQLSSTKAIIIYCFVGLLIFLSFYIMNRFEAALR